MQLKGRVVRLERHQAVRCKTTRTQGFGRFYTRENFFRAFNQAPPDEMASLRRLLEAARARFPKAPQQPKRLEHYLTTGERQEMERLIAANHQRMLSLPDYTSQTPN